MGEFPEDVPEWRSEEDKLLDGIVDPGIDAVVEGVLRQMGRETFEPSQGDIDLDSIAGIASFVQQFSWPHADSEASVLDELRSHDPGTYLYFREGARAYHEERHAQARDFLSMIPKPFAFVSYMIGESEFRLGNLTAALAEYEKVLAFDSRNIPALLSENYVYDLLKKPREQIAVLNRALAIDDRIHEAWRSRGFAYVELGRHDKACTDLRKAVELQPNDGGAHYGLSISLFELNKCDEARDSAIVARNLNPKSVDIVLHLGNIYSRQHQFSRAAEAFRGAVALCKGRVPQKQMALFGLGDALVGSGRYVEARTIADDLIGMGEHLGYQIRADALFGMKKYALAEADCRQLLDVEPDNKDALKLLGSICLKQGKKQDAKRYFKAAE
jgi:tetratricopeptide (TPR) repeat protein